MKVLFDYQTFSIQRYGGISRYFANLYTGLNTQNETEAKLGLLFSNNAYINNKLLPGGALNDYIKKESRRLKYNKWYCEYLLRQNNFDVFHPTYYNPYFIKSLKKPFVLTVYDMIHELFPQYFENDAYTRRYKKEVIERANHIIAISECTKKDIQKFYNVDDSKISVIHLGYIMSATGEQLNNAGINSGYILFVGDRYGYKNFDFFIKAVAPVILKHSIKLVCAGGGSFKPEELKLINGLNIADATQQVNITDDDRLAQLYKNAIAFIFPSLYEGFGLPTLEAFFNNCPVIMSNTCALSEVGGDAAEYFDPEDEQSIAAAIERVISSDSLQQELRLKGTERLKQFGFENCVQKTLQVYKSLV